MSKLENQKNSNIIDKIIHQSCNTCEFNFGTVCAGNGLRIDNGNVTYGMIIKDAISMFPNGCNDYGISLDAYIEQEEIKNK